MNLMRKAVSALGGIFLAALLIAALAPRATRGVVAAMVQVVNTSANPVPNQDVDNRGRATMELLTCDSTLDRGTLTCSPSFTVPAGQRLMMDEIDGGCVTPSTNTVFQSSLRFSEGGIGIEHTLILTPTGFGVTGNALYSINQTVRYVADSGSSFEFLTLTNDTTGFTSCAFTLTGHLISFP